MGRMLRVIRAAATRKLLRTTLLCVLAPLVGLITSIKSAAADPVLLNPDSVTRTFEQNSRFSARSSIDGTGSGWAVESFPINQPDGTLNQSVVWPLVSPLAPPAHGRNLLVSFLLSCTSAEVSQHTLGHFRLSYTVDSDPDLNSTFVPMTPDAISSTDPEITFSLVNQDILVGGANPNQAIYEVQFILPELPSEITAFRLDVFDENGTALEEVNGLSTGGPGRASNGNFVLTHVTVNAFYIIPASRLPPMFGR